MKQIKIKNSCGGSGCSIPAHERILPKGKTAIKVISIAKDGEATCKKAA